MATDQNDTNENKMENTIDNETQNEAAAGTPGTASAPGPAGQLPPPPPPVQPGPEQRLHRGGGPRMLGGVAVGLADYFDVDPTIVRVGFVALALLGGLAVPLYLAGWLLIPDEGAEHSIAEELLERERSHDQARAY
jgi:phage shock protein PspC (stress-responsive transcriptional regulator)